MNYPKKQTTQDFSVITNSFYNKGVIAIYYLFVLILNVFSCVSLHIFLIDNAIVELADSIQKLRHMEQYINLRLTCLSSSVGVRDGSKTPYPTVSCTDSRLIPYHRYIFAIINLHVL